jgi:transcriptional regulator with XRE-family HTH domain
MTPAASAVSIAFMAKPGRRAATPMEFRAALAKRIKDAREAEGFTHSGIAERLTVRIGRPISADTYRKWETIESSIPHDAILAFCDLTKVHPYELLSIETEEAVPEPPKQQRRMTDKQVDRLLIARRRKTA